jgi:tRNA nucleotidyltransferase (CCA-adding enzyme)
MPKEIEEVSREVLRGITPTEVERARMEKLAKALELRVSDACQKFSVRATVRIEGSMAKDTWIAGDPDIDVFIRLPTSMQRKQLGEIGLNVAKKATEGQEQIERFAEHPYLETFVDGIRVNIVPCYDAKPGEWLSATDRTPYHTDYIRKHMNKRLRNEVRLLKKFMKGIGVYGAEIKIGGFSGYLCEILVLHCGGFVKTLKTFAAHVHRRVIDIEGFYEGRQRDLDLLFRELLVVIDPVDKARNVASAVQPQKLFTFAAACRAFLKAPSREFFDPLKIQPLSVEELRDTIANRGSSLVFLTLDKIQAVPDVLWGQLYRTMKALRKQLELNDFEVLRDAVWSEDSSIFTMFVLELASRVLPPTKKHMGPPLELANECERFLSKYADDSSVVAGPFIENGRWVVEIRRKITDAADLLRAKVKEGGRDIGVAELIASTLRNDFLLLIGEDVTEHYAYNPAFADFLTRFLAGKPLWLEKPR